MKKIFIYANDNEKSKTLQIKLKPLLSENGFSVTDSYDPYTDFAIAIGGDGAVLRTIRAIGFADIPVLGINTGHLGFFTELSVQDCDKLLSLLKERSYVTQSYRTIRTVIETAGGKKELSPAVNDVLVRHYQSSLIHLRLSIGETFIENFAGDGVLIASSAGSTAYNYALGGSIIDPRIALLQVTPMAPSNNVMYRSFTSSIILPYEQEIVITPESDDGAMIVIDGNEYPTESLRKITVRLSDDTIKIARFPDYDFWGKVKSKFL